MSLFTLAIQPLGGRLWVVYRHNVSIFTRVIRFVTVCYQFFSNDKIRFIKDEVRLWDVIERKRDGVPGDLSGYEISTCGESGGAHFLE